MIFDDEPTYGCYKCRDEPNGWINIHCDGKTCDRDKKHAAHWFAVRCTCWLTRNDQVLVTNGQAKLSQGKWPGHDFEALQQFREGSYRWRNSQTVT